MPIIKDTRDHVNLASRVLYELEIIYTGKSRISTKWHFLGSTLLQRFFPVDNIRLLYAINSNFQLFHTFH